MLEIKATDLLCFKVFESEMQSLLSKLQAMSIV